MNNITTAFIIDDEDTFVSSLQILLQKNYPKVNIVGTASSVKEAVALIKKTKPNLLFLDINLPDGNGFDVLEQTNRKLYEVIFTTSYSEFAIRAFEFSALHYLLKPIELPRLKDAMEHYSKIHDNVLMDEKLQILKESLLEKPQKIILTTGDGKSIYNISDIVRCEADGNSQFVYFNNKQRVQINKSLEILENNLHELDFVRVHHKHLINLRYVKKYRTGRNPNVVLSDNTELPISQTFRTDFSERMNHFAKSL